MDNFKEVLAIIFMVGGTILGFYIGIWQMIIMGIVIVCRSYDAGTLTGAGLGLCLFKIIFGGPVARIIMNAGLLLGKTCLED